MIEQILGPIIKPIKRKILNPLRQAKKLPKLLLAKLRKWLVVAIFGPLRSLNNYLKLGSYYIAKKLIALFLVITLVIVYFGFISPPSFINKWFGRTPQLEASAAAAKGFNGTAAVHDADGNLLFEGQLVNGLYAGTGKLYYPDGKLRYQGDFGKGMMAGKGELFDDKGKLLYRGDFANDQYAGAGTLFYPDGKPKYEGQFAAGMYEGAGTFFREDQSIEYAGTFVKNVYNGNGKLYGSGEKLVYEGQFNNGMYEGAGKLFDSNGTLQYEGIFLAGKLSGSGKEYFQSGFVKYEGTFLLGGYHGSGSLFNETGSVVYTGAFANGQQNGSGQTFNAAGGIVYDGKFVNNSYEGVGSLFDADGAPIYKGFFRSGSLFAEGFMNVSLVKLQETLGAPDVPAPPAQEEADENSMDTAEIDPLGDDLAIQHTEAPVADANGEATAAPTSAPAATEADQAAKEGIEVQPLTVNPSKATSDSIAAAPNNEADLLTEENMPFEVILPQTLTFSALQMSFVLEVDEDNPESFFVQTLTTWNPTIMEQTYNRLLTAKTVSVKEKLDNGRIRSTFKSGNVLLTFVMNKGKPVRLEISVITPDE